MAVLYTPHYAQFMDDNGNPLSGGLLYTYSAGTNTPRATYTTAAGDVENANPVVLDAYGRAVVFLSGSYKFVLKDSDGTAIANGTTDNVTAFTTTGEAANSFFESFSGNGSETVFTVSSDLGTDEKILLVLIDAGGGKGFDLQPPSAYTISGTTLTFSSAPASGTNNIQVWAPSLYAAAASASAAAAANSEANAATSETNAATSETNAADSAAKLTGTSTTSVAIGTGSKAFTTQADKFFDVGQFVLITSDADEANYMFGQSTAYSGTSLTVDVVKTGGSGTFSDWTIRASGAQGAQGPTGSISDFSGTATATPAAADLFLFHDDDASASRTVAFSDMQASQAQAEAGTAENVLMNPLRTAQAISAISPSTPIANAGYATDRYNFGGCYRRRHSANTYTPSADTIFGTPFIVGSSETFTRIGLGCSALAGDIRFGVYNMAGAIPTSLVSDLGTMTTSVADLELTISLSLSPGLYMLAVNFQSTPTIYLPEDVEYGLLNQIFGSSSSTAGNGLSVSASHTYGALPSTFPSPLTYRAVSESLAMWLRKV